jgi:hypothetical protein
MCKPGVSDHKLNKLFTYYRYSFTQCLLCGQQLKNERNVKISVYGSRKQRLIKVPRALKVKTAKPFVYSEKSTEVGSKPTA